MPAPKKADASMTRNMVKSMAKSYTSIKTAKQKKDVKAGAAVAKDPIPMDTRTRKALASDDWNSGYIAAKKEIAAFLRQQGKKN
jgi:hypothetical protein